MDIKTMEENITEVSTPTKDDDDFTLEDMRALEDMHAKEASYDVKEDTFKDDFTLEDIGQDGRIVIFDRTKLDILTGG